MTTPTYITSSNTSVVVASNLTPTSTGVSGGAFAITARTVNNDTITVNAGVKVGGPTILRYFTSLMHTPAGASG